MRAAVLGSPIAHSLSPVLHRAAYAELGLSTWRYDAFDVTEATLPGFLQTLDTDWAGLSLTMPLKRAIRPFLASVSPLADLTSSVNTVVLTGAGGWAGHNTDVHGIEQALAQALEHAPAGAQTPGPDAPGHLIGAGATASSAVAALASLGCTRLVAHARRAEQAAQVCALAAELGLQAEPSGLDEPSLRRLAGAGLVVSTVPAGAQVPLPAQVSGILLDVIYHPWPTPLAQAWAGAGGQVVSGLEMLLHQASAQVELFTGSRGPLGPMRAAVQAALAQRAG